MENALILFSHKLTDEQLEDLKNMGVKRIISLPPELSLKWKSVPPEISSLKGYAKDFIEWIDENSEKGDYVLIQGDYGLTVLIVDYCLRKGLIPIYSTTERVHREVKLRDGSIRMEKLFKHKIFRRYEKKENRRY